MSLLTPGKHIKKEELMTTVMEFSVASQIPQISPGIRGNQDCIVGSWTKWVSRDLNPAKNPCLLLQMNYTRCGPFLS